MLDCPSQGNEGVTVFLYGIDPYVCLAVFIRKRLKGFRWDAGTKTSSIVTS
jgi:hypothetical protein